MFGEGKSLLAAAIATLLVGSAANAHASPHTTPEIGLQKLLVGNGVSFRDVEKIREAANGTLLAVGQLESVSLEESTIRILGQDLLVLASSQALSTIRTFVPGEMVAVFGEVTPFGMFIWSAEGLGGYVPGASPVYVSGAITSVDADLGLAWVGELPISYVEQAAVDGFKSPEIGSLVEIAGTQPLTGGVVLAKSMKQLGASVGTGKTSLGASVGTGKSSLGASVGTGKSGAGASVGTGKTSFGASVGTGKSSAGASVGTGKSSLGASVGTGKSSTGASVGTGKTSLGASVGTGKSSAGASVGTGKTALGASVGTGKSSAGASVGTGRTKD